MDRFFFFVHPVVRFQFFTDIILFVTNRTGRSDKWSEFHVITTVDKTSLSNEISQTHSNFAYCCKYEWQ